MTDFEEYIDAPKGEDCPRCGEPIHEQMGFVYAAEYWHIECYEKENGALPEAPPDDEEKLNDFWDGVRGV